MNKTTTRKQLQGYGATRYQAEFLTKRLTPEARQVGRSYAYAISDVIISIREYLEHPRIKSTTRQSLKVILKVLLERLSNVIEVPFRSDAHLHTGNPARRLNLAISNTNGALTELKATAATIKAKYRT